MTEIYECPYCKEEHEYEWDNDEVIDEECECEKCGKSFIIYGEITSEISISSYTMENHLNREIESRKRVLDQTNRVNPTCTLIKVYLDEIRNLEIELSDLEIKK